MTLSLGILNGIIKRFGSIKNYFNRDGGRVLSITETKAYFQKYIGQLNLSSYLGISFNNSTIARTSIKHSNDTGKSELVVGLPISYRINNLKGVFNHEIGTHFLRKMNDKR